jgi:hypothetical protein
VKLIQEQSRASKLTRRYKALDSSNLPLPLIDADPQKTEQPRIRPAQDAAANRKHDLS